MIDANVEEIVKNLGEDIITYILLNLDLKSMIIMRSLSRKYNNILLIRIREIMYNLTRFNTDDLEIEKLLYLCKINLIKSNIFAAGDSSFIITDGNTDPSTLSQVYAFGNNKYGQLGLGHTIDQNVPTIIKKLYNITQICSNDSQTLLLNDEGKVYTCGANFYGDLQPQLEWVCNTIFNNKSGDYISLRLIENLSGVKEIAGNGNCFIVLCYNGEVYIISSELNNNGIVSVPILISDLEDVIHISLNELFGLALTRYNTIYGFSFDIMNDVNIPLKIEEQDVAIINNTKLLTKYNTVRRMSPKNHELLTARFSINNIDLVDYEGYDDQIIMTDVIQMVSGLYHCLYLTITGDVYGMGDNQYGQLGLGTMRHFCPIKIKHLSNIVKIAAGSYHSLFLTADEKVYVCGRNDKGQLGLGHYYNVYVPTEIVL